MIKSITYPIGVDVLGFPMYVEHTILELHQNRQNGIRHIPKKQKKQIVTERIVKQH